MDEFERNRYPFTTTTPGAIHEVTVTWLPEVILGATPAFRPSRDSVQRQLAKVVNLSERAEALVDELGLEAPAAVVWAPLRRAWGRCRVDERVIMVSEDAQRLPRWVVDGIIVHELAHLTDPSHGAEFKQVVNRYSLAREVDGYLACVQERDWGVHAVPHHHGLD